MRIFAPAHELICENMKVRPKDSEKEGKEKDNEQMRLFVLLPAFLSSFLFLSFSLYILFFIFLFFFFLSFFLSCSLSVSLSLSLSLCLQCLAASDCLL